MARQVLDHGVIIPAEYSDDWYEDMSTNLEKLDEVIGSDACKLSEADVSDVALSGDYDDLTDKPSYGILRMTSETLSNSGSGAISNLNSDSKLAAGDYVLDAALKVFPITAVSAPNYTVGTSLFQITNASALAAVATSGSYDDLNNLPTYGITRFVNAAISDNSSVAFANISSVDKIKAGDFLLDNAGKMYLIASVDSVTETAAVTTPLTQLALDSGVVHINGNENINDNKNFTGLLTTLVKGTLWPMVNNTTDDITLLSANAVHVEQRSAGRLKDLSGGAWNIAELGNAAFFFRNNSGVDIRYKHFPTNLVNRIYVVNGANRHINDLIPDQDNTRDIGRSSLRWATFNGINPGALSLPDLNNGLDISGYITNFGAGTVNEFMPLADGWISIANSGSGDSPIFIRVYNDYGFEQVVYSERNDVGGLTGGTYKRFGALMIPCIKNVKNYIIISPTTSVLVSAKFYPNLGTV